MSILQEIYQIRNQQIDEGLGKTLATGALAAGIAMSGGAHAKPTPTPQEVKQELPKDEISTIAKRMQLAWPELDDPTKREQVADNIADEYRVNNDLVKKIVDTAHEHGSKDFPTAEDIIAIVSVESGFNPNAKSGLRRDPAVGLMQVRPGIWNIDPNDLQTIDSQIAIGAKILRHYFKKTGSAEDAIQAYNVGISNFRKGRRNANYVAKYNNFKNKYF